MADADDSTSKRKKHKPSGNCCAAVGCINSRYKPSFKGQPFFTFPKEEARREQWLENCGRLDLKGMSRAELTKKGVMLCSDHFANNQFTVPTERKRLNWRAVPTVFADVSNPPSRAPRKRKSKSNTNTSDELDIPGIKSKADSADVLNSPSDCASGKLEGKEKYMVMKANETEEAETEVWTVKQESVDDSFSKPTGKESCLVCNRPFKTTNNSQIRNLPFCKGCKNIYFTLVAKQSLSSPQQQKCPKGGQCIIDYKFLGPTDWCVSCHVRKFQEILRSSDALQMQIEKLTDDDLASLCMGVPAASRSDTTVTEKNENGVLPPPKPSTDLISPHQPFPLYSHFKRRRSFNHLKKLKSINQLKKRRSIHIYVFACGHPCSKCNSNQAKKWLKDCGFHTTSPSTADAINPTINHCTNSLSPPAQDNLLASGQESVALSGQQSDRTQPENSRELHTHCSVGHGSAVSQNSQETSPSGKSSSPVILSTDIVPPMSNNSVLYGSVPTSVLLPEDVSSSDTD